MAHISKKPIAVGAEGQRSITKLTNKDGDTANIAPLGNDPAIERAGGFL